MHGVDNASSHSLLSRFLQSLILATEIIKPEIFTTNKTSRITQVPNRNAFRKTYTLKVKFDSNVTKFQRYVMTPLMSIYAETVEGQKVQAYGRRYSRALLE